MSAISRYQPLIIFVSKSEIKKPLIIFVSKSEIKKGILVFKLPRNFIVFGYDNMAQIDTGC